MFFAATDLVPHRVPELMLRTRSTMARPPKDRKTAEPDQPSRGPNLLEGPIRVVNVGLHKFADDLVGHNVEVVQVDWAPPARGNTRLANLLSRLMD